MNPYMKFDVRTIERNMREGRLTQAELDAHLAQLPDDAEVAETSAVLFTTSTGVRANFGVRRDDES